MTEQLLDFFKMHQLIYKLYEHEPVFTVPEGVHLQEQIPGAHSKNLFLKDKKNGFFLVSLLEHKQVDIKALARDYGKGGLSFAKPEALMEKMQLTPGSVTPYGLMHDTQKSITFLLDQDFQQYEAVNFHPLRNDRTLHVAWGTFLEFFRLIEHPPTLIAIPEKSVS